MTDKKCHKTNFMLKLTNAFYLELLLIILNVRIVLQFYIYLFLLINKKYITLS